MRGVSAKIVAALCAVLASGCSLLKVSVATGDPLPREAVRVRMMTRGFYYELADEVTRAADSIVAASPDLTVRVAAVRWKIRVSQAGVTAAMQGIPDVALADLWILCRRMDAAFAATPDSLLFGAQSPVARAAAGRLDRRAALLARRLLDDGRYALMERFVEEYVAEHPSADAAAGAGSTTLAWVEYLREHGVEADYATGSIAEVLADVNDRVSGRTQQLSDAIGWSKDIIEMQLQRDSLRAQIESQLDTLERHLGRMVAVAEDLPAISERMMADLNELSQELMYRMDRSVDRAFVDFDRQRGELQTYVSRERQELLDQLRTSAQELVRTAADEVPGLVGRVLLCVVLALAVLIGGPFAAGFWLGGVRERAKARK